MRLHYLRVTAFGPFAGTEEIDFDELAAAGLYLIHGPTGAGKTSILDAICFALYAALPGARAGARRSLRSDHADAGTVPQVVLELTVSARRFRVVRSPEFDRPRRRGSGTTAVQARVAISERVGGAWSELSTRHDEAALLIQDVMGIGLDQFVKVVLLPQGDFAAFLRANPEQRRQVLERLFDIQRFTDIEDWLAQRRRGATAALDAARDELRVGLARIDEVLAGLPSPVDGGGVDGGRVDGGRVDGSGVDGSRVDGGGVDGGGVDDSRVDDSRVDDSGVVDQRSSTGRDPIDRPRRPSWDDIGHDALRGVLTSVQSQVAEAASQALAEAELSQRREDSASADLARGRVVAAHQHTARTARATLAELARGRGELERIGETVALAGRAGAIGGHLVAEEEAARELARVEQVADDCRAALRGALRVDPNDLTGPDEVTRAIRVVQAGTDALAGLASHAEQAHCHEAVAERLASTIAGFELDLVESTSTQERLSVELADARAALTQTTALACALPALRSRADTLARAAALLAKEGRDAASWSSLQSRLDECSRTALRAGADALRLRHRRLDDMAGELAAGLADGVACPVCGSCSHPRPALHSDPVTAQDIATAETVASTAIDLRESVRSRLAGLRAIRQARAEELAAALAGRDPATVDSALGEARASVRTAQAAAAAIPRLTAGLDELAQAYEAVGRRVDDGRRAKDAAVVKEEAARLRAAEATRAVAEGLRAHRERCACAAADDTADQDTTDQDTTGQDTTDQDAIDGDAGTSGRTAYGAVVTSHRLVQRRLAGLADALVVTATTARVLASARARLRIALTNHGFADAAAARAAATPADEVGRLAELLRAADRQRHQARALLSQPEVVAAEAQPAPDLAVLEGRYRAMRGDVLRTRRAQTMAEGADHRIRDLSAQAVTVLARIAPLTAEQATLLELADCVGGTGPNNTLRMRLSSYLLAARLEEVARFANERLSVMSEGRYALEHTDTLARRGARSGLGLRVQDAWTGTTRETAALSGGESFMASLALALGLGDAVQADAGGLDLQTLFVDEGFGTLDEDSLDQVMGVIDGLRERGRAVGIVSHVADLRQRIGTQVMVEKTPAGSRIRTDTGAA